MNWCKFLGHKWIPFFVKGEYNNENVRFIGCYCSRCYMGEKEAKKINSLAKNREYGTYSEKFFIDK